MFTACAVKAESETNEDWERLEAAWRNGELVEWFLDHLRRASSSLRSLLSSIRREMLSCRSGSKSLSASSLEKTELEEWFRFLSTRFFTLKSLEFNEDFVAAPAESLACLNVEDFFSAIPLRSLGCATALRGELHISSVFVTSF